MSRDSTVIQAIRHHDLMLKKYHNEIKDCTIRTKQYSKSDMVELTRGIIPQISLDCITTTEAIRRYAGAGKLCILNFASFKYPGGQFLKGSMAQEEALCHYSILYEVLKNMDKSYYSMNRAAGSNGNLYRDKCLYSKDIIFEVDSTTCKSDVISCAAPNWRAAKRFNTASMGQNNIALSNRIKFLLNVAEQNNVEVLVLGAFGCGVFGQDPELVATIFKDELLSGKYSFRQVVFAVPDATSVNYNVFNEVFG